MEQATRASNAKRVHSSSHVQSLFSHQSTYSDHVNKRMLLLFLVDAGSREQVRCLFALASTREARVRGIKWTQGDTGRSPRPSPSSVLPPSFLASRESRLHECTRLSSRTRHSPRDSLRHSTHDFPLHFTRSLASRPSCALCVSCFCLFIS